VLSLRTDGALGDCRVGVGSGRVRLDQVAGATLRAGSAELRVVVSDGDVSVDAGSGRVQLDRVAGAVEVEAASGAVELGDVSGDLRIVSASGRISVGRSASSVDVRSAAGRGELGELVQGRASVTTKAGDIVLGIARGTAAWLDLTSTVGRVINELDEADGPDGTDERVEIRATTTAGDITVRRAAPVGA
jgi:DUF4097 and DUF4098 domain-containing protein YvlB